MKQLLHFGYEQAMSCIFPVIIFVTLATSKMIAIPYIPRYDFILIICLLTQILMVVFKLESWDEVKVICIFHIIGLSLEIYKVNMGSWSYPEEAYTKLFGVPLYSGFMYASVASYMCQAWRRLDLRLVNFPSNWIVLPLSVAIYFNFYWHHFFYDIRWYLKLATLFIFLPTFVYFTVDEKTYKMPLSLSFLLIGFFIWMAENIATFFGAWRYPNQQQHWEMVHIGKISSWFLLVIISFLIVAMLKHVKKEQKLTQKRKEISL